MKTFKKLQEMYNPVSVGDLEKKAEKFMVDSVLSRKHFIEILFYLERTNRFKENRQFKNTTFKDYIKDRFYLRYGTYHKERIAFFTHPKEVEQYGVGVVNKVREKCGVLKVKKVFDEVKKAEIKKPLTRENIENIININAKQVKKKAKKITKDEAYYIKLCGKKDLEIQALNQMIKDRDEQIDRLKATVQKEKKENEWLSKIFNIPSNDYQSMLGMLKEV